MLVDLFGLPAPYSTVISVIPDQFLFFRINADNRQTCYSKSLSLRGDVLKLLIPLRILRPHLLPLIGLEGEVHSLEQAPHRC